MDVANDIYSQMDWLIESLKWLIILAALIVASKLFIKKNLKEAIIVIVVGALLFILVENPFAVLSKIVNAMTGLSV